MFLKGRLHKVVVSISKKSALLGKDRCQQSRRRLGWDRAGGRLGREGVGSLACSLPCCPL